MTEDNPLVSGIRILRATDLPEQAAAHYVRIHGMARQYCISLREEFDEHDTPGTKYIVAMDGYQPVATCRLYPYDTDSIMLGRIVVLPSHRGQRLGKRVVLEAEKWASELGYTRAVLDSREEKTGFYERLGYRMDPGIVTEGTFRCIRMEKELAKMGNLTS